jgi:hypothetical protein
MQIGGNLVFSCPAIAFFPGPVVSLLFDLFVSTLGWFRLHLVDGNSEEMADRHERAIFGDRFEGIELQAIWIVIRCNVRPKSKHRQHKPTARPVKAKPKELI